MAKDLLTEDGVIFISIDDNEQTNLKKVCDEVFGERNFLTCVTRATGTPTGGGFDGLVNELDYIFIYAKNVLNATINGLEMSESDTKIYDQEDEYGKYLIRPLRRTGGEDRKEDRPTMYFGLEAPDGSIVYPKGPTGYDSRWICGELKYKELVANRLIEWKKIEREGNSKWNVYQKFYLEGRYKAPGNLWVDVEGNKKATRDIRTLFDTQKVFDFPKPVGVLLKAITIGTNRDSIILDFFSGSATTAHAVMQLNAEDGGNRKFIMVQLPEKTDEKSEGYKNICEIGKERIRRAGKKIKEDLSTECEKKTSVSFARYAIGKDNDKPREQWENLFSEKEREAVAKEVEKINDKVKKLDTGFRVLKLDSSNMQDVYYTPKEFTERDLFADNVKPDRTAEDLLFQVMLDLGVELSATIEQRTMDGKQVFFVNDNYLVVCFDTDIAEDTIKDIAKLKPYYFVMRDSSLASDNVADNFDQLFETYSKDTIRRII